MHSRFIRTLFLMLLSLIVVACATPQTPTGPSHEHVDTAKRFLSSWGAADLAMKAFKRKMDSQNVDQPASVAELNRRVFATIKAEDFVDIASRIYARHLSLEHLTDLTRFTESPTGNKFFRIAVGRAMEGESSKIKEDMQRQFNADELTEIMKFAMSEEFSAMKQAIPDINREMAEAGREFGQKKMREYLEQQ